jgi:hypothetical protein
MKNSTYATLSGYASTYCCSKAAVFLLLFSIFSLSAFAQTAPPPIEVILQPGETAVRQISVTNPEATSVNYQTAVKETTASLARRTVAPTSFDGLEVVFSTGFEDYAVGDLGFQKGWDDRKIGGYYEILSNTIPVVASVSTADPLNGEKHLAFESVDTVEVYTSYSPQVEPEQTSSIRSAVFHINLTGIESGFELFTYERNRRPRKRPQDVTSRIEILAGGLVVYVDYDPEFVRKIAPYTVDPNAGYIEVRYVLNRIAKTYSVYFDGRRIVENAKAFRTAELDGIMVVGYNNIRQRFSTPTGPSMYLDDLTIADGDASTPEWISTSTASGTLPAQGSSTLDVALNAQGLAPGTYEAEVQVLDEAFGTVSTVPVTLIVEEPPVNPIVEKLNLTSMCSSNPDTLLRWRIRNPNDFAVDVTWQVYGSTQSATVSAPAGDSFFFTQTEAGANTTIIRWKDEEGRNRQKIKASGKAACDPANARVASPPKLNVYPMPVKDQLNVAVEGTTGGALSIYDQTGRVVYRGSVSSDSPLQLNAQALQLQPRRLYVVSVQTPTQRVVRKIMME